MLRGKAKLLQRSVLAYEPVITELVAAPAHLWTLDVDGYDEAAIKEILKLGKQLRATSPDGATDALVTKVLLGTMGCVPAFDRYFTKGFQCSTFGPKGLHRISEFYQAPAGAIEAGRERTLNFDTGQSTQRLYTRANVIDMIFFVEGERRRLSIAHPRVPEPLRGSGLLMFAVGAGLFLSVLKMCSRHAHRGRDIPSELG